MHEKIPFLALPVVAVLIVLGLSALPSPGFDLSGQSVLKRFSSYEELKSFVSTNTGSYGAYDSGTMATLGVPSPQKAFQETAGNGGPAADGGRAEDYSATNIQVAGVDEPDTVKNDGKYIYTVAGEKIVIVDAYPAESARVLSETNVSGVQDIFVNGNRLVAFGQEYSRGGIEPYPLLGGGFVPPYYSTQSAYIKVFDITDKANPVLIRNVSLDGNYYDSRMIGDYVYVIVNQPTRFYEDVVSLPVIVSNGVAKAVPASEIYYFDVPDYSYQYTTIIALNTQNDAEANSQVILTGSTENTFVSLGNIYLTYAKRVSNIYMMDRVLDGAVIPLLPADVAAEMNSIKSLGSSSYENMQKIGLVFQNYVNRLSADERADLYKKIDEKMQSIQAELAKEMEKTVVHRIAISNGAIGYKASGEFPGYILNQFSMDEYNGYFRVATTTSRFGGLRGESVQRNHVYVLDANGLGVVGKLEDLAPGESIYSARFMGDRAYLVTFKKTDPLFVLDLANPSSPQVLGQLKILGYSNYLHPYDETHLIGIGKEATESEEGDFAWYQGVKLSLFDVSDVEHPKEISTYSIGDRGTDSYALYDHKAFLFSKSKNLLVIPILLAEIDEEKYPGGVTPQAYGDYVWQGAYVFSLDTENGFVLKGKITHQENDSDFLKAGFYYFSDASSVKRSLYMDETLYTISSKLVKANDLATMSELNRVNLPFEEQYYIMDYGIKRIGGSGSSGSAPPEI